MGHLSGAPLLGRLLALPESISPECKGLPGTNAVAIFVSDEGKKKFNDIETRPPHLLQAFSSPALALILLSKLKTFMTSSLMLGVK